MISSFLDKREQTAMGSKVPFYITQSIRYLFDIIELYVAKVNLSEVELNALIRLVPQIILPTARQSLQSVNTNNTSGLPLPSGITADQMESGTDRDALELDSICLYDHHSNMSSLTFSSRVIGVVILALTPSEKVKRWAPLTSAAIDPATKTSKKSASAGGSGESGGSDVSSDPATSTNVSDAKNDEQKTKVIKSYLSSTAPSRLLQDEKGEQTALAHRMTGTEYWDFNTAEGLMIRAIVRGLILKDDRALVRAICEEDFLQTVCKHFLVPTIPSSPSSCTAQYLSVLVALGVVESGIWADLLKEDATRTSSIAVAAASSSASANPLFSASHPPRTKAQHLVFQNALLPRTPLIQSSVMSPVNVNSPPGALSAIEDDFQYSTGNRYSGDILACVVNFVSRVVKHFPFIADRFIFIWSSAIEVVKLTLTPSGAGHSVLLSSGISGVFAGRLRTSSLHNNNQYSASDDLHGNDVDSLVVPSLLPAVFELGANLMQFGSHSVARQVSTRLAGSQHPSKPWISLPFALQFIRERLCELLSPSSPSPFLQTANPSLHASHLGFSLNPPSSDTCRAIMSSIRALCACVKAIGALSRTHLLSSLPPSPALAPPAFMDSLLSSLSDLLLLPLTPLSRLSPPEQSAVSNSLSILKGCILESITQLVLSVSPAVAVLERIFTSWSHSLTCEALRVSRGDGHLAISLMKSVNTLLLLVGYKRRYSIPGLASFTSWVISVIMPHALNPLPLSPQQVASAAPSLSNGGLLSPSRYWMLASLCMQYLSIILKGPLPPVNITAVDAAMLLFQHPLPAVDETNPPTTTALHNVASSATTVAFMSLLAIESLLLKQVIALTTVHGLVLPFLQHGHSLMGSSAIHMETTVFHGLSVLNTLLSRDSLFKVIVKNAGVTQINKSVLENNMNVEFASNPNIEVDSCSDIDLITSSLLLAVPLQVILQDFPCLNVSGMLRSSLDLSALLVESPVIGLGGQELIRQQLEMPPLLQIADILSVPRLKEHYHMAMSILTQLQARAPRFFFATIQTNIPVFERFKLACHNLLNSPIDSSIIQNGDVVAAFGSASVFLPTGTAVSSCSASEMSKLLRVGLPPAEAVADPFLFPGIYAPSNSVLAAASVEPTSPVMDPLANNITANANASNLLNPLGGGSGIAATPNRSISGSAYDASTEWSATCHSAFLYSAADMDRWASLCSSNQFAPTSFESGLFISNVLLTMINRVDATLMHSSDVVVSRLFIARVAAWPVSMTEERCMIVSHFKQVPQSPASLFLPSFAPCSLSSPTAPVITCSLPPWMTLSPHAMLISMLNTALSDDGVSSHMLHSSSSFAKQRLGLSTSFGTSDSPAHDRDAVSLAHSLLGLTPVSIVTPSPAAEGVSSASTNANAANKNSNSNNNKFAEHSNRNANFDSNPSGVPIVANVITSFVVEPTSSDSTPSLLSTLLTLVANPPPIPRLPVSSPLASLSPSTTNTRWVLEPSRAAIVPVPTSLLTPSSRTAVGHAAASVGIHSPSRIMQSPSASHSVSAPVSLINEVLPGIDQNLSLFSLESVSNHLLYNELLRTVCVLLADSRTCNVVILRLSNLWRHRFIRLSLLLKLPHDCIPPPLLPCYIDQTQMVSSIILSEVFATLASPQVGVCSSPLIRAQCESLCELGTYIAGVAADLISIPNTSSYSDGTESSYLGGSSSVLKKLNFINTNNEDSQRTSSMTGRDCPPLMEALIKFSSCIDQAASPLTPPPAVSTQIAKCISISTIITQTVHSVTGAANLESAGLSTVSKYQSSTSNTGGASFIVDSAISFNLTLLMSRIIPLLDSSESSAAANLLGVHGRQVNNINFSESSVQLNSALASSSPSHLNSTTTSTDDPSTLPSKHVGFTSYNTQRNPSLKLVCFALDTSYSAAIDMRLRNLCGSLRSLMNCLVECLSTGALCRYSSNSADNSVFIVANSNLSISETTSMKLRTLVEFAVSQLTYFALKYNDDLSTNHSLSSSAEPTSAPRSSTTSFFPLLECALILHSLINNLYLHSNIFRTTFESPFLQAVAESLSKLMSQPSLPVSVSESLLNSLVVLFKLLPVSRSPHANVQDIPSIAGTLLQTANQDLMLPQMLLTFASGLPSSAKDIDTQLDLVRASTSSMHVVRRDLLSVLERLEDAFALPRCTLIFRQPQHSMVEIETSPSALANSLLARQVEAAAASRASMAVMSLHLLVEMAKALPDNVSSCSSLCGALTSSQQLLSPEKAVNLPFIDRLILTRMDPLFFDFSARDSVSSALKTNSGGSNKSSTNEEVVTLNIEREIQICASRLLSNDATAIILLFRLLTLVSRRQSGALLLSSSIELVRNFLRSCMTLISSCSDSETGTSIADCATGLFIALIDSLPENNRVKQDLTEFFVASSNQANENIYSNRTKINSANDIQQLNRFS